MTAASEAATAPLPPAASAIHEAERASGPSGAVWYGVAIDLDAAVARRKTGADVVVRGDNHKANRQLANRIESAVGPAERQDPHKRAGPLVLPHYQQSDTPPEGHTFYETDKRKARKGS
jgi:hypothetical protein